MRKGETGSANFSSPESEYPVVILWGTLIPNKEIRRATGAPGPPSRPMAQSTSAWTGASVSASPFGRRATLRRDGLSADRVAGRCYPCPCGHITGLSGRSSFITLTSTAIPFRSAFTTRIHRSHGGWTLWLRHSSSGVLRAVPESGPDCAGASDTRGQFPDNLRSSAGWHTL
jgi:hypothetical protein